MRSLPIAIGLVLLIATATSAQLLDPRDNAAKKDAQGKAPADAGKNAPAVRNAAPQPNAMFAAIDVDGDGVITKAELRKAIKALMTLDTDNDGNITLEEASPGGVPAVGAVTGRPGGNVAGGDNDAFAIMSRFDVDGDKRLSIQEVPPALVRLMRPSDDLDQSGYIEPAELQGIMRRSGIDPRAWAAGDPKNAAQRTPFRDPNRRRPPRDNDNDKQ